MAHHIGFAGYSNSGKTTLIAKVVTEMKRRGYRVGVMKHDAHGHYKEKEGTDSTTFIRTGADAVVTISPEAVHVYEKKASPELSGQLEAFAHLDYIIIEGFKKEKHPKIAVIRTLEQTVILDELDPAPIAVVSNLHVGREGMPSFHLDDASAVASFIVRFFEARQY
ncbi:molybdopterin-guanine dinucleotide biosynthesis protein B [Paenibacillus sp. SI8]|uniref:molybdopterin-guanine dinucleotide biosynthesis protein B n=1 Tax=unclassified Paenibacillus TaxID=185978 RepID=UPI0034651D2C